MKAKHAHQYFGPWAITPQAFSALRARYSSPAAFVGFEDVPDADLSFTETQGNTAVIDILGEITKYPSCLFAGTSTLLVRKAIREMMDDSDIKQIVLNIDSPGGTVSGVDDLARTIHEAGKVKPVYAYIEDMCGSAAYWLASQCTRIYASPSAYVGSIGVYCVIEDSSKAANDAGYAYTVVQSAKYKAGPQYGVPLSEDSISEVERDIDTLDQMFVGRIASTRGDKIRESATGQLWPAYEALNRGLIDEVRYVDDVFALTVDQAPASSRANAKGGHPMAEDPKAPENMEPDAMDKPTPATIAELKEALPDATSEQLVQYLEDGLTTEQAMEEYGKAKLQAMEQENEELKEQAKALDAKVAEMTTEIARLSKAQPVPTKTTAKVASDVDAFSQNWRALAKEKGKQMYQVYGEAAARWPAEHKAWGVNIEKGGN
jgi:signal peptide peptidase SppA